MDLQSLVKEVNLNDINFGYCIPGCYDCCNMEKAVDYDRSFVEFLVDNNMGLLFEASITDGSFKIPRSCCFNFNNIDDDSIGLCGVYTLRPFICKKYLCSYAKLIKRRGLSVALKESFIDLQGSGFNQFFFDKAIRLLVGKKKLPVDLKNYFVNGYKLLSNVFDNYEFLIDDLEVKGLSFDEIKSLRKEYNSVVKGIIGSLV